MQPISRSAIVAVKPELAAPFVAKGFRQREFIKALKRPTYKPIKSLWGKDVVYANVHNGEHVSGSMGAASPVTAQNLLFMERRLLPPFPAYAASSRQTIQVDRDGVLMELRIRLTYTVTIPNTSDCVGATYGALASLIRRLEIIVDGQDTTLSMSGRTLFMREMLEQGQPFGTNATVVLTKNTATTYNIILRVPMYQPKAQRSDDTALDLRTNVSQVIAAITWGDATDIFQTATAGTTITNVQTFVEGHYLVNCDPKKTFYVRAMDEQIWSVVAAQSSFPMLQDRGQDIFYRSFVLLTMNDNAVGGGVPGLIATNAILEGSNQNIKVLAGALTYQNRDAFVVRGEQSGDPWNVPLAQLQTGVYPLWMPLLTSSGAGSNATLINTGVLTADLYLQAGVTVADAFPQIWVSREAMRPLRA